MRIRSRVIPLRRERGMTVDALAERSGVPRSTVDKWGREGVPVAVAHAVRIADALGVEVRGRGKDAVVVRGRRDGTDKWR